MGDLAVEDGGLHGDVGQGGGIGGVRVGCEYDGVREVAGRERPELLALPEGGCAADGVGVDRLGDGDALLGVPAAGRVAAG